MLQICNEFETLLTGENLYSSSQVLTKAIFSLLGSSCLWDCNDAVSVDEFSFPHHLIVDVTVSCFCFFARVGEAEDSSSFSKKRFCADAQSVLGDQFHGVFDFFRRDVLRKP